MKINLHGLINKIKANIFLVIFIIAAFAAGCLCAGFFVSRSGSLSVGELDNRYNQQYGRAAETINRLEIELERERDINIKLREYNTRARELTYELAVSTERNVRNLQDAVSLIGEIRRKLKVLEDFYNNSGSGGGGN